MSTFLQLTDVDKGCPTLVNLDKIVQVVPLKVGGCELFLDDYVGGTSSKASIRVSEDFSFFEPYGMTIVTHEGLQGKINRLGSDFSNSEFDVSAELDKEFEDEIQLFANVFDEPQNSKKSPGRPKKTA